MVLFCFAQENQLWILVKNFNSADMSKIAMWMEESRMTLRNANLYSQYLHIQIPPHRLRGSHITQYRWGYCKSKYCWGYYKGTLTLLWQELLCIQKLQGTLIVSSTVLRLAVATTVLRNMRPTSPVGGIWMCRYKNSPTPYFFQLIEQKVIVSVSGFS